MKFFLILIITIYLPLTTIGQQTDTNKSVRQHFSIKSQKDMVFNPGFELHSNLFSREPQGLRDSGYCWGWISPSMGVPTYCWYDSIIHAGPMNALQAKPRTGNACIGITIIQPGPDFIEHIQGILVEPLEANHYYKVSFWVRLSSASNYATCNIGALLSKNRIFNRVGEDFYIETMNPELKASVSNPVNKFLTDTTWTEISGVFKAKGGERYITIGMFWDNNPEIVKAWLAAHPYGYAPYRKEFTQFTKMIERFELVGNKYVGKAKIGNVSETDISNAYYFLDDASVKPLPDGDTSTITNDTSKNPTPGLLNIEMNKNIVFDAVLFEEGRSDRLLSISNNELDQLVSYLQENDNTIIKISAYTDNSNSKVISQAISDRRAAGVASYLSGRIDSKRIKFKGYGSANPIASNNTKEGRDKNFRVEFRIENK
ncbi:MAG TPA: OmpA family protein [Bacteroidia bacterium]|jgi:OOP family OmpA-OmpF porin|nr:OmpA family protein [Bacteroidia bacterium]